MKKLKLLTLATLIMAPLAASANGFYAGAQGGYGMQTDISDNHKSTRVQADLNGTGVGQMKLGYDFNDYFGLETRVGAANKNSEMLHHYSAYVKAQYPITDTISVYGLVGGTDARMTDLAQQELGTKKNLQSASYAVGGAIAINDQLDMTMEYNQVSTHKDYELGAVMVGVNYKF
ncbi:outer membrane beta-barrel protein [Vibrio rotiferianus]|uniref:outer membrane beta-barrel protein n=1 Tax=Vibrio rotiferianus TaxID=190895 RepID=UPI00406A32DB